MKNVTSLPYSRALTIDNELALEPFVTDIPYKNDSDYVYTVYPETKYEKTILGGYGDCSTMSFGAAYYLLKNNISFELIHFLPPDTFLSGGGHVALRVPYHYGGESRIGILDIIGGGLPHINGEFVDVADLAVNDGSGSIHRVNDKASDFYDHYYKQDYLKSIFLGITPGIEVERYYQFLENFYYPFGHEKLEKMAYDGLAIFFGQYYSIYVDEAFLNQFNVERYFFQSLLLSMRLVVIFLVLFVLFEILSLLIRKKS